MGTVNVSSEELKNVSAWLLDFIAYPKLKADIKALKGFDWSLIDNDNDEFNGFFEEWGNNLNLVLNVINDLVHAVQQVVIGGLALSDAGKHKAVCDAIDKVIRLPFFLEPFDDIMIDMLVKQAVKYWKAVNWGTVERGPLQTYELKAA